ncbi:family 43 glycosylhydrolase [Thermophilibacter sp.]
MGVTIENPVLRGFHPDPCLCAAHGRYYLATSTFQWLPAVSLYVSDDLVSWRSVGGALPGLDLRGVPDSAGVWAPDLTFDESSGLFWLTYTVCRQIDGIFKDVSNYVVTAERIEGPWSDPVFVNASGFDPGFYHEDGHHYVLNPQWDPRPLPGHHRFNGLLLQEFSLERGLMGEARVVLGNEDAVNWLREGPHIMRRGEWYYIACAEGGTGRRHRIRMARSRDLWGPYEVCPEPLVCAWCSETPLRKAGHGNFVRTPDGEWYVCHLTSRYLPRPDGLPQVFDVSEQGVSPLGRECALQRVVWEDGWPRLASGSIVPQVEVAAPARAHAPERLAPGQPGYRYETSFSSEGGLGRLWLEEWLVPRHIDLARIATTPDGLALMGGDSPSSLFDQSLVARRVTSFSWRAETALGFAPRHYNQLAGLVCAYDARAFACLCVGWDEGSGCRVIDVLVARDGDFSLPLGPSARLRVPDGARTVTLAMECRRGALLPLVSLDGRAPVPVRRDDGEPLVLDASVMSDERVPGWAYTGTVVGLFCVDMFDKTARATFSSFSYEDLEGVDDE